MYARVRTYFCAIDYIVVESIIKDNAQRTVYARVRTYFCAIDYIIVESIMKDNAQNYWFVNNPVYVSITLNVIF